MFVFNVHSLRARLWQTKLKQKRSYTAVTVTLVCMAVLKATVYSCNSNDGCNESYVFSDVTAVHRVRHTIMGEFDKSVIRTMFSKPGYVTVRCGFRITRRVSSRCRQHYHAKSTE